MAAHINHFYYYLSITTNSVYVNAYVHCLIEFNIERYIQDTNGIRKAPALDLDQIGMRDINASTILTAHMHSCG